MPNIDRFDTSDEGTGLPSLGEGQDITILALKGNTSEGLVMLPTIDGQASEPVEVVYMHVRGLVSDSPDGQIDWAQISLAIPKSLVEVFVERLSS